MAIPHNINREHIKRAISEINIEDIPPQRLEQHYSLIEDEKSLPPKYVISIANKYANGVELGSEEFNAVEAKNYLLKNKFKVIDNRAALINYYVLGAAWYGNENGPDQTERFIQNGIWENGYDDKFLNVVNSVNIGDRVAIKSSFATRDGKSILRVKAIGTVNDNLGDGRTLKINWDKNFVPFDLEGYGGYRNTIQKVSSDDIDIIFNSYKLMNYYPELTKFLSQAKTAELGTSGYLNNYQGLSVKVSFGKGNQARIPWIAFLNDSDNVQEGIYPVYLFYKDKNLLMLAYGVSETHASNRKWNISSVKTVEQYFADNNLGKPERYGSSYVFKSYEIKKGISEKEINQDLNELISIYKANSGESKKSSLPVESFNQTTFYNTAREAGYFINEIICVRFISSLLTKPFVILTGLSGSGKTKMAQALAKWICEDDSQYCMVPVGADWTNREPLLGFPNALRANDYVKPDNKVLDLIIDSNKNLDKPYFLILDEMNLSHVERYFADFLSVMESNDKISLHAGPAEWNGVPAQIGFPKNLFIIGTVNIDETTYMFSPKVLDRASVIEFRVTATEMEEYLQGNYEINLKDLEAKGSYMAQSFVAIAKDTNLEANNHEALNVTLLRFFLELKKTGAEFGYRSAKEILRFAAVVKKLEAGWDQDGITDSAIMQKLLPKVHGSRRKLEPVLKTLGMLCLKDEQDIEELITKTEIMDEDKEKIRYQISFEKIQRMYHSLISNGFTSYAEA